MLKTRGRPPTTGRYATREELERMVRVLSQRQNDAQVARVVGVSETVVRRILAAPPGV